MIVSLLKSIDVINSLCVPDCDMVNYLLNTKVRTNGG